jgi:hypothetical protein
LEELDRILSPEWYIIINDYNSQSKQNIKQLQGLGLVQVFSHDRRTLSFLLKKWAFLQIKKWEEKKGPTGLEW